MMNREMNGVQFYILLHSSLISMQPNVECEAPIASHTYTAESLAL